jgi:hypothetical protein
MTARLAGVEAERGFDLASGDVEHHRGHDVMADQHGEFENLVLVELTAQLLVRRRGGILGGEQLVGGGDQGTSAIRPLVVGFVGNESISRRETPFSRAMRVWYRHRVDGEDLT